MTFIDSKTHHNPIYMPLHTRFSCSKQSYSSSIHKQCPFCCYLSYNDNLFRSKFSLMCTDRSHRGPGLVNIMDAQTQKCACSLKIPLQAEHCEQARCAGTRKSFFHKCFDFSYPFTQLENLIPVVFLSNNLTRKYQLNLDNTNNNGKKDQRCLHFWLTHSWFFILRDVEVFLYIESSLVIKSIYHHMWCIGEHVWFFCELSWAMIFEQIFFRLSFCSWVRFLGSLFTHSVFMFASLCKTCLTISLLVFTILIFIQMFRSFYRILLIL